MSLAGLRSADKAHSWAAWVRTCTAVDSITSIALVSEVFTSQTASFDRAYQGKCYTIGKIITHKTNITSTAIEDCPIECENVCKIRWVRR